MDRLPVIAGEVKRGENEQNLHIYYAILGKTALVEAFGVFFLAFVGRNRHKTRLCFGKFTGGIP
jgi:hypothetical protein